METMTVLEGFAEYEGDDRVHRPKGSELTVSAERADELREKGLARKKPASRKLAEAGVPASDPGMAQ